MEKAAEILLATRKLEWKALYKSYSPLPKLERDTLEVKLLEDLISCSCNIQKENALIIISCGLLYLDF